MRAENERNGKAACMGKECRQPILQYVDDWRKWDIGLETEARQLAIVHRSSSLRRLHFMRPAHLQVAYAYVGRWRMSVRRHCRPAAKMEWIDIVMAGQVGHWETLKNIGKIVTPICFSSVQQMINDLRVFDRMFVRFIDKVLFLYPGNPVGLAALCVERTASSQLKLGMCFWFRFGSGFFFREKGRKKKTCSHIVLQKCVQCGTPYSSVTVSYSIDTQSV